MNNGYGYNQPNMIKNFDCLRRATLWAGSLGVLQSIAWIGLTIVGIVSYNCVINDEGDLTYGSLIQSIFLHLYFRGNCKAPTYSITMLKSVPTVLDPESILIWDCVYLAVAVCWLIASGMLFIYIKKNNVKLTAGVMLTWVIVTLCICAMDLALGVIFGIDYGNFHSKAYDYNLFIPNGEVNPEASQLIGGMVASISMMIISFKGFVLWIMNFVLLVYLFVLSLRTLKDKDGNDTLFMPRKNSVDIMTTRPPIQAFEEEKVTTITAYSNDGFVAEDRSVENLQVNQEVIARAARMSTEPSLQDRRFRNIDTYHQYPPPRYNTNSTYTPNNSNSAYTNNKARSISMKDDETLTQTTVSASFPVPDYTPPMARANRNPSQNGGVARNQRH